jgi:hypothetical protein
MALNKAQLKDEIHQAFKKMQDSKPPANAGKAQLEKHFADLLLDLAKDLSNALDTYVRSGDVVGVQSSGSVALSGNPQTVTVNTAQSNVGRIQ